MRILITGAGGSVGSGLVDRLTRLGHDLVLTDIQRPNWLEDSPHPFHQLDIQIGVGLNAAADGCDLLIHTPAWHGIHSAIRTETDFWRLNVDGTFWALQAARSAGIGRVVFLSSQSWHGHYAKYGFTKRMGEELLEYHRQQHGLSYVAVRPGDFTPWGDDWPTRYGRRLLYGGVDREDVLDAVMASAVFLENADAGIVLDAVHPDTLTDDILDRWDDDPLGAAESAFPGARTTVERFGLDITTRPAAVPTAGWRDVRYSPTRDFGTFVTAANALSDAEIAARATRT